MKALIVLVVVVLLNINHSVFADEFGCAYLKNADNSTATYICKDHDDKQRWCRLGTADATSTCFEDTPEDHFGKGCKTGFPIIMEGTNDDKTPYNLNGDFYDFDNNVDKCYDSLTD